MGGLVYLVLNNLWDALLVLAGRAVLSRRRCARAPGDKNTFQHFGGSRIHLPIWRGCAGTPDSHQSHLGVVTRGL